MHLGNEGEDLKGGFDFIGFQGTAFKRSFAAAAEKGEGRQPAGQGPRNLGAAGIEIGLEAAQQSLEHAGQEGSIGLAMAHFVDGHPETFRFGGRGGPVRQGILTQALLPHEDQDPFHGRGRIEAQNQGFQEGEFLGSPPDRPGQLIGNARGLLPGAVPILKAGSPQVPQGYRVSGSSAEDASPGCEG